MKRTFLTVLTFILMLSAVFQVSLAQDVVLARTIPITSIGFGAKLSPDGKTLVTFENAVLLNIDAVDPTTLPMRVIDISTGDKLGQLMGYSDYASDVAFTSDGSKLVSVHMNGDVNVWDMATREVAKSYQTPLIAIQQVRVLPDDKTALILVSGLPQRVIMFDLETGAITGFVGKHFDSFMDFQTNYTQFPGSGDIMLSAFAVSADGTQVVTATANDEVGVWSLADNSYQLIREKGEKFGRFSIRTMQFTPDGKSLVYFDAMDKLIHIWDFVSQSEKTIEAGADLFALSPDGTLIAWGGKGDDGDKISIAPLDAPEQVRLLVDVPLDLKVAPRVTWLAFTPDGKQMVVGGFFASEPLQNQIYVADVF